MKTLCAIALVLFLPLFVEAAPLKVIKIEAWSIQGDNGLSLPQTIRLFNKAKARFKHLNIDLKVTRFRRTFNRFYLFNTIEEFEKIHGKWANWVYWKSPKTHVKVVILPPLRSNSGLIYFGGAANLCAPDGVAWSNAGMKGYDGSPRFKRSLRILVHELGHIFGATHDDEHIPNIMMSDISKVDSVSHLWFSKDSIFSIRNCLNLF